jgi:hypothetical protein
MDAGAARPTVSRNRARPLNGSMKRYEDTDETDDHRDQHPSPDLNDQALHSVEATVHLSPQFIHFGPKIADVPFHPTEPLVNATEAIVHSVGEVVKPLVGPGFPRH